MPSIAEGRSIRLLVVLAVLSLVYSAPSPALERRGASGTDEHDAAHPLPTSRPKAQPKTSPKPGEDIGPLPPPVEEMRQAILAAAHSGNLEDLRAPLEWNELKPDIAPAQGDDVLAFLKKASGDGEGREILAVLAEMLELRPAKLPLGKDIENNIIYVWPYLAEAKLDALTPAQEVELLRLVTPEQAKDMRRKKKWTWWRLTIGADGTWHSFKKAD